jgi:putative ABC transport system permease protein
MNPSDIIPSAIETIARETSQALRFLMKRWRYSATVVMLLSVGLALCTIVWSCVDVLLLQPFSYPHSEQLYVFSSRNLEKGVSSSQVAPPDYLAWRASVKGIMNLAAYRPWIYNQSDAAKPADLLGAQVTPEFLSVLGVNPILGRGFIAGEARPGSDREVLLAYPFWKTLSGGDTGIIGRSLRLNDETYNIVGVLPPWFRLPEQTDVWVPLAFSEDDKVAYGARFLNVLGRIESSDDASAPLARINAAAAEIATARPLSNEGWTASAASLRSAVNQDLLRPLRLILLLSLLLLAVTCGNIGNLVLLNLFARRREVAIRYALGAGLRDLARQLLVEALILVLCGTAGALLLAHTGLGLLAQNAPQNLARLQQVSLDESSVVVASCLALLCTLAFGLLPVTFVKGWSGNSAIQEGPLTHRGASSQDVRAWMAAGQVFASTVLGILAFHLIQAGHTLNQSELGFQAQPVLVSQMFLPSSRFATPTDLLAMADRALAGARQLPGVGTAGFAVSTPFSGFDLSFPLWISDHAQMSVPPEFARYNAVSPGYLETLRIPLQAGRFFNEHDSAGAPRVAIVNRQFALRFLPGRNPIGLPLIILNERPAARLIVGVVGNTRERSLAQASEPAVYEPFAQHPWPVLSIAVEGGANSSAIRSSLARTMRELPGVTASAVVGLQQRIEQSLSLQTASSYVLMLFAVAYSVFTCFSLYAVVAGSSLDRKKEFGIRVALGANFGEIAIGLVRSSTGPLIIALVAGELLGATGSLLLASVFYGLSPLNVVPYLLPLFAVPLVVCAVTWRAATQVIDHSASELLREQ